MTDFDEIKFKELISKGDTTKASKLLNDYFLNRDLADEEKGEALVNFYTIYVRLMTLIYGSYNEKIQGILDDIKFLNKKEIELDERMKLSKARLALK